MFTAIISGYRYLYLQLAALVGYGWAIVALSFICSFLMLPLMRAVAGVVRREKEYEDVIDPQVAEIKAKYAFDMERHQHIQSLYARYAYSPLAPIKKVLPLFVQIPFLLLTYYMLKGTAELGGIAFLFLSDLGRPDALLAGINILPLIMTGVNILTVFATPGFSHKDWTQAIAISLLFLVLLYTAPSALLLYWTLNNTITFVRTLCEKKFAGAVLLLSRIAKLPSFLFGNVKFLRPSLRHAVVGFLGIMLLAMPLVAYLLLEVLPQDIRLEVASDAFVSISVEEIKDGNTGGFSVQLHGSHDNGTSQLYREYLSPDVDARSLAFKFDCSSQNRIVFNSIRHVVGDLFTWELSAADLRQRYVSLDGVTVEDGPNETIVVNLENGSGTLSPRERTCRCGHWKGLCPTGEVLPGNIVRLLIGFVVLAFVLSLLGSSSTQNRNGTVRCLWVSASLALVVSLYALVVLPLQGFLANAGDYSFSTWSLISSQALSVMMACVILTLGLYLTSFAFGWWPQMALIAFLVYEYLHTGILSLGAPPMNGDMSFYEDQARGMLDVSVLVACVFVCSIGYRYIRARMGRVIVAIATVIAITSLCSFRGSSSRSIVPSTERGFCSKLSALKNITFSKRNVVVLVLDSITTEVASEVLRHSPEISRNLTGFTVFENNIGMHHETDFMTAGMLTGCYFTNRLDNANDKEQYLKLTFSDRSVLSSYADAGCHVYFVPSAYDSGMLRNVQFVEGNLVPNQSIEDVAPIHQRKSGAFSFSLRDLTIFRLAPYQFKRRAFDTLYASANGHGRTDSEESVFPILKKSAVSEDDRTSFIFIHTHGSHCPHDVDRDGHRRVDRPGSGYEQYYDHVYYVLKQVGDLFKSWDERGIYSKSYIVLTSDHGSHANDDTRIDIGTVADLPPRAHPMLCIKPLGNEGDLRFDRASPTCHARLHELLEAQRNQDLSLSNSVERLSQKNRMFIIPYEDEVIRWTIESDGTVKKAVK